MVNAALCGIALLLAACGGGTAPLEETSDLTPTTGQLEAVPVTAEPVTITPAPTLSLAPTVEACAQREESAAAHFVSETIPDYTNLDPGTAFSKSWTICNAGSTTWTTEYDLVFTLSTSSGVDFDTPQRIPLPNDVPPGQAVTIAVDLITPDTDGFYSLYYSLHDEADEPVMIDGGNLWVSVVVGNPTVVTGLGDPAYAPQLIFSAIGEVTTQARFCMPVPDATPSWFPFSMTLLYGDQRVSASGAAVYDYQGGTYRCYEVFFDVGAATLDQYDAVRVSIGGISIDSVADMPDNCARTQEELRQSHPGLTFTCTTPGFDYTITGLPAGMDQTEAGQLIMDALERRVYGPWTILLP
jgi:hypothetical protein